MGKARAACLPSGTDASRYEGAATYNVSGWGTLASGGSQPEVLNVVQVPPVSDTVCKQQYGASSITPRMMCAGKPGTGGVDSCQGDGECDDINNTEECQWDGGDCCGDNVVTDHCSACECLDPDFGNGTTTEGPGSCRPEW